MKLELETGPAREISSARELREALATVGAAGNRFAVLSWGKQSYIQTEGSLSGGFRIEVREGSEDKHFCSKKNDITQAEMIDVFLSYYAGVNKWRDSLQWKHLARPRRAIAQRERKLATYRNSFITLTLSVLLFVGSIFERTNAEDFAANFEETTGTVLTAEVVSGGFRNGSRAYAVTVRYLVYGREFSAEERVSGAEFYVGKVIPIVYDKRDPGGRKRIGGAEVIWGGYYFLFVSSIMLAIVGTALFVVARLTPSAETEASGGGSDN